MIFSPIVEALPGRTWKTSPCPQTGCDVKFARLMARRCGAPAVKHEFLIGAGNVLDCDTPFKIPHSLRPSQSAALASTMKSQQWN